MMVWCVPDKARRCSEHSVKSVYGIAPSDVSYPQMELLTETNLSVQK